MNTENGHLPEAGFSATVKLVNPKTGFEWLVTTRAEQAKDGWPRLALIEEMATKAGYLSMDAYIDQRKAERSESAAQPAANGNPPPMKAASQPAKQQSAETFTFQGETLEATVNKGKAYWKAKGGKFAKFGVTIWPEVLAAAGFDELDPMEVYNIGNRVVRYTLKEDGKPDKVVGLDRD